MFTLKTKSAKVTRNKVCAILKYLNNIKYVQETKLTLKVGLQHLTDIQKHILFNTEPKASFKKK